MFGPDMKLIRDLLESAKVLRRRSKDSREEGTIEFYSTQASNLEKQAETLASIQQSEILKSISESLATIAQELREIRKLMQIE